MLSPVLLNIYENDQPVHKNRRSLINTDEFCIATQDASFEKPLSDTFDNNVPTKKKTQTYVVNRSLTSPGAAHSNPDITFYIFLTEHSATVLTSQRSNKAKTAARTIVIKKLSNLKWGANPATIRTTALATLLRNMHTGSNDSRLHVVEPPRRRSSFWQIGVNLSIQNQRQVDQGFWSPVSCARQRWLITQPCRSYLTTGTLNDLTMDLIMANNSGICMHSVGKISARTQSQSSVE